MGCNKPLTAYKGNGGGITFNFSERFVDLPPLKLPCGRCHGCRVEKSKQWAIRLQNESRLHAVSCFLTLTYDDENLPEGNTLVKEHAQKFIRALRDTLYPLRS